MWNNEGYKEEV